MKIVGFDQRVVHFMRVEDAVGEVHEIPIEESTYVLMQVISSNEPVESNTEDWMRAITEQVMPGNGRPQPVAQMPSDLATKLQNVGMELGPIDAPEADIHREEEQDPGEMLFQDPEGDADEVSSL